MNKLLKYWLENGIIAWFPMMINIVPINNNNMMEFWRPYIAHSFVSAFPIRTPTELLSWNMKDDNLIPMNNKNLKRKMILTGTQCVKLSVNGIITSNDIRYFDLLFKTDIKNEKKKKRPNIHRKAPHTHTNN